MMDWAALRHCYGDAADLPAQIEALVEAPSEEKWQDLWSCLCHQGTVYPASFAAIPLFVEACPRFAPRERRGALMLIGAIWASPDRFGGAAPSGDVEQLVPTIRGLIAESMRDADVDAVDFIYLLQAAASFYGDRFWGSIFDQLASGEFQGACPVCESMLFLAIGPEGNFTSSEDYVRNAGAKRVPIEPAAAQDMPTDGAWLYAQAAQHGQDETADGITHVFGTTSCPKCDAPFSVDQAIRAWLRT